MRLTRRGFLGRGAIAIAGSLGAIIGLPAFTGGLATMPAIVPATYRITANDLKAVGLDGGPWNKSDGFIRETGGTLEFEWTLREQLKRIQGPLAWYFWFMVRHQIIPVWSMAGVNLVGARMWNAHLEGVDLRGANLEGIYLQDAHLQGANLEEANLKDANLAWANMDGSNLASANLEGANLSDTLLYDACLSYANLRGVDLRSTSLSGARLFEADLRGAEIGGGFSLRRADLFRTDLRGCWFLSDYRDDALEQGAIL